MFSAKFSMRVRNIGDIPAFTTYNVTTAGVSAGGGGPTGSPGSIKPTIGSFSGSSASTTQGLALRAYWANSNAVAQTYQSPRDAVFIAPSSNWTVDDITNLGITYTDVTTSSATRTINITFNIDNIFTGGYYVITRSGTPALSLWATGTYTQQATYNDTPAGRGANRVLTWTIPAPSVNQLIVPAWTDDTGSDNLRWVIT